MLFDPNRGRLPPPNLDDRTWSDLIGDAIALIPQYAPQWTNQGPSDIGITLIELFAYLVEGLTYRLNQVPDKNYIAFLNLLGITRVPPDPARAFLTFAATTAPVLVAKGSQAQTAATETLAPIVFETDQDLTVLPVNLESSLLINKSAGNTYSNVSGEFTVPPATGATLNIPASQSIQLCLGFDQASTAPLNLLTRLFQPLVSGTATVTWLYSTTTVQPALWTALPALGPTDGTAGLTQDGVVQLTIPPDWTSQAPPTWAGLPPTTPGDLVNSAYFWIGLRIANLSATEPIALGVSWILFNAVSSYSALTIAAPETLGTGDGSSFQVFPLANGPLFATPGSTTPYSHLVAQVSGVTWTQVDDFPEGPGQYYRVDPIQSQISFGNYDPLSNTGHGTVPQSSDTVVATTYRYVEAGAAANVGAGSIVSLFKPIPGVSAVTNLFSAYGGSDAEAIAETMRRAPQLLRNRDRAITVDDYEFLTLQASSELATACCLPPTDAYGPGVYGQLDRGAGNVNVIIVPALGPEVSAQPQPTPELLQAVTTYLDGRRDLTALLHMVGPRYLPVDVTITAAPWAAAISAGLLSSANDLQAQIEAQIQFYLHPVVGGADGTGWQVGQHVYIADLYKAIMPAESLGFISELVIQGGTPLYVGGRPPPFLPPPPAGAWVRVADFELVCLGAINFTLGPAT